MTERSSRSRGDAEGEGVIGIDTRGQHDSPCLAERASRARRSIEKFRVYASFYALTRERASHCSRQAVKFL